MTTSLARNLASQSVHLTIHPPPRSLSESKLVLSALQKYGEVVTFKNLKYDKTNTNPTAPRNTIAVFESPQAARSAIASSPLKIALPSPSSLSSASSSTPNPSPSPSSLNSTDPKPNPRTQSHPQTKTLFCNLQPSRHNHLSSLHRNPCYGSFKIDKESHQAVDLRETGVPVKELADVPVRWKLGSSQAQSRGRSSRGEVQSQSPSPSQSQSRGQGRGGEQGQEQGQARGQGQIQKEEGATGEGVFAWSRRKRCKMGGTSLQALFNTKVGGEEGGEGGKAEVGGRGNSD